MKAKSKVGVASLIITLGIVYGDIGTSPLYVMSALMRANNNVIDREYILGAISLVIWTLILITTVKYVMLMLKADNNGEGGVLSLYTLIKKNYAKLLVPAIIGSAALLADSIITPAVTVTSAIEGLDMVINIDKGHIVIIAGAIITALFFFQHYGTSALGKVFGSVMLIWFSLLAIFGISGIILDPTILSAINPYYGINLLISSPFAFVILGAVFLCTTGAEALYSDLGHCGKINIYYTWVFVKIALVLNYLGQGAKLLQNEGGQVVGNPFFGLMPEWFMIPGVILATLAAIIASQSLISGASTLISEAIKLEYFPRLVINYPSQLKGQVYIPAVNFWMWIGCLGILLFFRESANMEAAYGLAITIAMLMTTILYFFYMKDHKVNPILRYGFLITYLVIEGTFFISNLLKIPHGGYVTILIGVLIMSIMYIWIKARKITASAANRVCLKSYAKKIELLQADERIPFMCTNLVYLTQSQKEGMVEKKVMYSLLNRGSKKAQVYWFVNVHVTDEPYTMSYKVDTIKSKKIFKVHIFLGFKVNRTLSEYIRDIKTDMVRTGELDKVDIPYRIKNVNGEETGDTKYIIINENLGDTAQLTNFEHTIVRLKLLIKRYTISPARWFGIDFSNLEEETLPLIIRKTKRKAKLKRVDK